MKSFRILASGFIGYAVFLLIFFVPWGLEDEGSGMRALRSDGSVFSPDDCYQCVIFVDELTLRLAFGWLVLIGVALVAPPLTRRFEARIGQLKSSILLSVRTSWARFDAWMRERPEAVSTQLESEAENESSGRAKVNDRHLMMIVVGGILALCVILIVIERKTGTPLAPRYHRWVDDNARMPALIPRTIGGYETTGWHEVRLEADEKGHWHGQYFKSGGRHLEVNVIVHRPGTHNALDFEPFLQHIPADTSFLQRRPTHTSLARREVIDGIDGVYLENPFPAWSRPYVHEFRFMRGGSLVHVEAFWAYDVADLPEEVVRDSLRSDIRRYLSLLR